MVHELAHGIHTLGANMAIKGWSTALQLLYTDRWCMKGNWIERWEFARYVILDIRFTSQEMDLSPTPLNP